MCCDECLGQLRRKQGEEQQQAQGGGHHNKATQHSLSSNQCAPQTHLVLLHRHDDERRDERADVDREVEPVLTVMMMLMVDVDCLMVVRL